MDQRKPLTYPSLISIVQYMDARFRAFQVFHLPSLRDIQKSVPLRFDVLKLDKTSFTLDNTKYSFNFVRVRNDGATQKFFYDVDEFGVEDFNKVLMPGDIEISSPIRFEIREDDPVHGVVNSYVTCEVCTSSNNPSPYVLENHEIRSARFPNGIKLRDSIRRQISKILAGRRVHQVKMLKIKTSNGILRFPEGLKLKIRELTVQENGNRVINAILPILDASSFPLESLSFKAVHPGDPVFQNAILRASESLIIRKWGLIVSRLGANLLTTLPNKNIYLENEIPMNEIVSLARNWMQHHRVIGTKFSMQSESVNKYLLEIKKELGAVLGVFSEKKCNPSFSCYILPLNLTSQLNVYEKKLTNETLHLFVMEVMPIESAKQNLHPNQTLKCIIQYMNINFRTIHSSHFPSLRNIQKSVPLRFDVLKLDRSSFSLDNKTHSFYTVLDSPDEQQPSLTTLETALYKGKSFDVCENGLEDESLALMPGDIVVKDRRPLTNVEHSEEIVFGHQPKYNSFVFYCIEEDENNISQAFYSPFGTKLRDTIRKKLNEVLGGSLIHQVEHLQIETSDGILRLPEGLKLKIRELSVVGNSNSVIDAILPILDASSFPLKSISVEAESPDDPVFQNEILRASESVIIKKRRWIYSLLEANLLITLPNKNIYLKNQIPINEIVTLARNWMQNHRIIGTKFSMQSKSVNKYLLEIKKELGAVSGVFSDKKCYPSFSCYIPLNPTSQLNVYKEKLANEKFDVFVMEVMPIKSAKSYLHHNETLKCITQYMSINFRTIHSPHFPSLRNIQKSVPLRFDVLKLDKSSFTLDNTKYSFNIMTERTDGTQKLLYDVDEFGDEDFNSELMPGDIVIAERQPSLEIKNQDPCNYVLAPYVTCEFRASSINQLPYVLGKDDIQTARSLNGKKLRDLIRTQISKLLGGSHVHLVKTLKIETFDGILRLPEGLKLKIQELSVLYDSNATIRAILPILDASSFPLKSLSVEAASPDDPVFQNEILKTSQTVIIKSMLLFNDIWTHLLITLPNPKIHFKNEIPLKDIFYLVRMWMKQSRVIGTKFSMESASVRECLYEIQSEWKEGVVGVLPERKCTMFFSCFTLPMTSTSELNIYGDKSPNYEEEVTNKNGQPCMIVMEVMPIGTAKPLKYH